MKKMNFEQMEVIYGGQTVMAASRDIMLAEDDSRSKVLDVACGVVGIGSGIYGIGVLTNWWNPVGWISGVAAVASIGCGIYAIAS